MNSENNRISALLTVTQAKTAEERGAFDHLLLEINELHKKTIRLRFVKDNLNKTDYAAYILKEIEQESSISNWLKKAYQNYTWLSEANITTLKDLKKCVHEIYQGNFLTFFSTLLLRQIDLAKEDLYNLHFIIKKMYDETTDESCLELK